MKPFNPQTYLAAVEEFHRAFQYRQPTPTVPLFDKETVDLRITLLKEESNELQFAESNVLMLDAFCDLQYVLSGAILALGLRKGFEKEWRREEHAHGWMAMGTYIHWFEVNLLSGENTDACAVDCVLMQNALLDKVCRAGFRDVFDEAFVEVHHNNMGKLCTLEQSRELLQKLVASKAVESSPGKYIVTRHDGKIIKPLDHKPVELERFCKP